MSRILGALRQVTPENRFNPCPRNRQSVHKVRRPIRTNLLKVENLKMKCEESGN